MTKIGTGTVNLDQSNQTDQNEYIDIIDVIAFLWRAKFYFLVGSAVGLLMAGVISQTKKPPHYVTQIPVHLDVAGGINFDQTSAAFARLLKSPEVTKSLELAQADLASGALPVSLKNLNNDLVLEVSLLSADPTGEKALAATKAISGAAQGLNKKIIEAASSAVAAKPGKSDLESRFAKVAAAQASEEAPLRTKLFALEARLSQKSGMKPTPAAAVNGTVMGDDVLRLLGAIEGKLTSAEQQKIIFEYSEVVGQIKAIQAKYEQPTRELTGTLSTLSLDLIRAATGDKDLFPVVVPDEPAYKGLVAVGAHEQFETKRTLFLALGVILGGILGLMAYGVAKFFEANKKRLREIF